ncbi:hypothetical protein NW768_004202 [Fusarium equiseti]|uniref:Uncharacterized protein n=1 Tax=Fusarium equiseti TaxID=61235 RepID=A0ABQ8RJP5_FUSEQ|nr:hypothetical protein NW768_004202 [Fusarium equiseti]
MRLSLQSLAIYLVSTQAGLALAGPCRPLTTTSVSATTTTAASEEVSTTAVLSEVPTMTSEEETSTTFIGEESTTTMILDVSTTARMEESTATTVAETTTAMLAETTTAAATEESTTTLAETTTTAAVQESTTTLAETTTTASGPEPSLFTRLDDGTEIGVYLQSSGFVGTTEADGKQPNFALEADTSRLYATFPDGSKVYAYTVIPVGNNYGFLFEQYDSISAYPETYSFITCTTEFDGFLTCSSEKGRTRIYWYLPGNSPNFYGNLNPTVASSNGNKPVEFKLPTI